MTTIATNAAARARRGRYGLAQVTLMEWLKLRSLRSTWWDAGDHVRRDDQHRHPRSAGAPGTRPGT